MCIKAQFHSVNTPPHTHHYFSNEESSQSSLGTVRRSRTSTQQKYPLVATGRPKFTHKSAPSPSAITTPSKTPILRPTPLTNRNGIRIQSDVFPQYTFRQTDRQTDTQTHRPTGLFHERLHSIDSERRANNSTLCLKNIPPNYYR